MTAKTPAQHKAEIKTRRLAAGLVQVTNLWVRREDLPLVRAYAQRLVRMIAKNAKAATPKETT